MDVRPVNNNKNATAMGGHHFYVMELVVQIEYEKQDKQIK
jgi:hypothetical protein